MAAPGTFTLFGKNKDDYRINDILAATLKMCLVSNTWVPNVATGGNSVWADMSANEVSGNGWTAGGITLTAVAVAANAGLTGYKLSSADVSATASGGSIPAWRYALIRVSGVLWGMTDPVIGYFVGDSTPADIPATTVGNTLTLACPTTGWFDAT